MAMHRTPVFPSVISLIMVERRAEALNRGVAYFLTHTSLVFLLVTTRACLNRLKPLEPTWKQVRRGRPSPIFPGMQTKEFLENIVSPRVENPPLFAGTIPLN